MAASATEAPGEAVLSAAAASIAPPVPIGRMRSTIDGMVGGAPLGESEIGKAWCLKALHPADGSVISSPMPTYETRSFASVGFNQLDLISLPTGGSFDPSKPWSLKIYLLRDPCFLFAYRIEQTGISAVNGFKFSRQINEAATYAAAYAAVRDNCERFRMTSQSITAYFDAASQTDQGHLICAQTELPRIDAPRWPGEDTVNDMGVIMPVTWYQDPLPSYEQLLQTSRPYQAHAKDGVYSPSKLLNIGKWIYTNQAWQLIGSSTGTPTAGSIPFSSYASTQFIADQPLSDFVGTFPYARSVGADPTPMVFQQTDTSLTSIHFTGIAPTSSVRITTRWTLDMVVRPGTVYAPFARMPPPADMGAIRMYAEVSRRMPDGHPSNFNNLGFLLPLISKVASAVLPTVLPKIGGWISDRIRSKRMRGGVSALELLGSGTPEEHQELSALMDNPNRTPEEQARAVEISRRVSTPAHDFGTLLRGFAPRLQEAAGRARYAYAKYKSRYSRRAAPDAGAAAAAAPAGERKAKRRRKS